MEQTMLQNGLDLCSLIRGFLQGSETPWQEMDLSAIHRLAQYHSMEAIAHAALEQRGALATLEPELATQWLQERTGAAYRHVLFAHERRAVSEALEQAGIWYLPLKGSILAELYPGVGLRQMGDVDILFDPTHRAEVRELMTGLGYETICYMDGKHDVYTKSPYFTFEMHVALFGNGYEQRFIDYYSLIEKKLLPIAGMERTLSPEDQYIYHLAHGHAHFAEAGNGLRFLMDCQVLRLRSKNWNRHYIEAELDKLGLLEFEELAAHLAEKLFCSGVALTKQELNALTFCLSSGSHGSLECRTANNLRKLQSEGGVTIGTRMRYLLGRFWPNQAWFEKKCPVAARYRYLKLPFLLARAVRGLLRSRHRLWRELSYIFRKESDSE